MKNFLKLMFFVLLISTALVACGEEKKENTATIKETETEQINESAFPVKLSDALGKEVTIAKEPQRIVSLIPSNTEILFAVGAGNKVVGVNDNDNYPKQVQSIQKVGAMEFNLELIISLQPDLVLAHESALYGLGDGVAQLEAAGIPVFVVKNAINFEETYDTISQIGQLTGHVEKANQVNKDIQTKLAAIKDVVKDAEPKSAFIVVGVEPDIYAVGKKTYLDEMLQFANIKNAVTEEGWPMYSSEQFVASDTDFIIATYESDLSLLQNNALFKTMKAIQTNQLVTVDGDITSRQGPRLAEGVELLAKAVYPHLFNE